MSFDERGAAQNELHHLQQGAEAVEAEIGWVGDAPGAAARGGGGTLF